MLMVMVLGLLRRHWRKTCLTAAGDAAFVPFEFVDEKNQIVGFDVDLAKAIGEAMAEVVYLNLA